METQVKPRIALVYPPFGPPNLPSLGLAILSAGTKQRGFDCRTFFWHYRFTAALPLPGASIRQKLQIYELFTQRDLFPWNEWIFQRYMYPERLQPLDKTALDRLAELDASPVGSASKMLTSGIPLSALILQLCNNAGTILGSFAKELEGYDIIGIGSTFYQNGAALALAKFIKQQWPEKIVVLGGANTDGEMGHALMELYPEVDYVFSGESDHAFVDFLECLHEKRSAEHVPGLIYRDATGKLMQGPKTEPVRDMNGVPVPDFDDYVEERKRFGLFDSETGLCLPLESSRGCWWGAKAHCTFCGLNANGMSYRQKDYSRFQDEVKTVVERYQARYLFMADNILSTKYYREFIAWAREHKLGVDFFYEIKANMTRQQVRDLSDSGITMVQPGIESFSSSILHLMRKGLKGIQNIAFLKYAADYGLIVAYNILAGFPGEDPNEYDRMSDQLPKLFHFWPPNGVVPIEFHRFSPYHNNPDAFGIRLRPIEKYYFVHPFDEQTVARIAYVFEVSDRTPTDLVYIRRISRLVESWRAQKRGKHTLTWAAVGDDVLVEDRRADFPQTSYVIRGHAASVYKMLDEPRPLRAVARDAERLVQVSVPVQREGTSSPMAAVARKPSADSAVIEFSEAAFASDPEQCIAPLVKSGIVYEEDGWYITLPVMAARRPINEGWGKVGV